MVSSHHSGPDIQGFPKLKVLSLVYSLPRDASSLKDGAVDDLRRRLCPSPECRAHLQRCNHISGQKSSNSRRKPTHHQGSN